MATKQTFALIIKVMDHGESDKIITFYCPSHGKLSGIAKGAKRSKKRFVNKLELFTLLDIQYASNTCSTLVRIDNADLINSFVSLRQKYDRYTASSLLCELIIHWTRENDGDKKLYNLLFWAFDKLDKGEPISRTIILFQIRLLDILGFRPNLSGCLECGKLDAKGSPYQFSPNRSGLICNRCAKNDTISPSFLSLSTAKLLLKAQDMDHNKISRLQFSSASTQEAITMLKRYERHLLQREIHSWSFLPMDR